MALHVDDRYGGLTRAPPIDVVTKIVVLDDDDLLFPRSFLAAIESCITRSIIECMMDLGCLSPSLGENDHLHHPCLFGCETEVESHIARRMRRDI